MRAAIMAKSGEVITFEKKGPAKLLGYMNDPPAARALAGRWASMDCAPLATVQAEWERVAKHVQSHEPVGRGSGGAKSEALKAAEARKAKLQERL